MDEIKIYNILESIRTIFVRGNCKKDFTKHNKLEYKRELQNSAPEIHFQVGKIEQWEQIFVFYNPAFL